MRKMFARLRRAINVKRDLQRQLLSIRCAYLATSREKAHLTQENKRLQTFAQDFTALQAELFRVSRIREKTEQGLTLYKAEVEPQLRELRDLKRFVSSVEIELLRVSLITEHVDLPTLHNVIPMEVTRRHNERRQQS